jgi:uncharacterized protein (TIGR03083 family)
LSNADIVIAALRTGYDRLAEVVRRFDDEDLARPSAASEWDIAQVLSHLGSGAEIMTDTVERALDSRPRAEDDFNQQVWARWDAASRRQQANGFLECNQKLTRLFESLDAGEREKLRIDLSYLPAPGDVATVGRMRLSELTHHSWDVRSVADPTATLDAEAVPQMLQATGDLSWISKPAALDGRQAVLTVTTTEPASEFSLRLTDPLSIDPTVADDADGALSLPAEAWLRLTAGRLGPDHTPSSLTLTGPIDLPTLRRIFPGY